MNRTIRESLIGAWELVSRVETGAETGEAYRPVGDKPQGLLLYTPDGYMSARSAQPAAELRERR
jgi:hypothetical protein